MERERGVVSQVRNSALDVAAVKFDDREVVPCEVPSVVLLTLTVGFEKIGDRQVESPGQGRLQHHISEVEVREDDRVDDVRGQRRAPATFFSTSLGFGSGAP